MASRGELPASVEVAGSARDDLGEGGIRRCALPVGPTLSVDGLRTIYEVMERSVRDYPGEPCLGYRVANADGTPGAYTWSSYEETWARSMNFGSGLEHFGLCPPNSDKMKLLGFFGKNRPEWVIGDMGSYSKGVIPVPLYDTLGAESVEYVVRQTEVKTILCTSEELDRVKKVADKGLLTAVVLMDGDFLKADQVQAMRESAAASGMKLLTMLEVEAAGRENPSPLSLPKGKDVAFFCYTSGTTGDPKGALITHEGIISCLSALRNYGLEMYPTDIHLSYLPLPHVFERGMLYSTLYGGGRIGFYSGDTQQILDDIQALRPTVFPSVPRLLNKVYDKLIAGVAEAGGVKEWLFNKALASKVAGLRRGHLTHPIWDRLVFKAVRAKVGLDRVRIMMTGSAPIASHVLDFLRAVFGCPVCEGYGSTESSLLISLTPQDDFTTGHVGAPAPCNEVRLIAVDDMGYRPTDTEHSDGTKCRGRGEICFRGPNVFKEYYRMPEKTADTIDEDGWVHTGDVGMWTTDGKLRIIDRVKNIFKLAQGEYVAAEKIENVVARSSLIAQTFVYGDSLQNSLVAIVVPDFEILESRKMPIDAPATKEAILASIKEMAKAAELKGFEIPKAIYVHPEEFNLLTPRDGVSTVFTPTFKLVRNKAQKYFQPEIDQLYEEVNAMPKSKL